MGQLYKITFEGTHKAYIGITTRTAQQRFSQHCEATKNYPINKAIRKYTKEKATVHVLAEAASWEELCALEIQAIKEHNTKVPHGYNCTDGGEGAYGLTHSDSTREKIAEANRVRYLRPGERTKAVEKLREFWASPEERLKQSQRTTKHFENLEMRLKMAEKARARLSDPQVRKQMSEKAKERWRNDPALRAARSEMSKVQFSTEEGRKKASNAALNRPPVANETRRKIGENSLKVWAEKSPCSEDERIKRDAANADKVLRRERQKQIKLGLRGPVTDEERIAKRRGKNPNLTPEHIAQLDKRRARRANSVN